MEAKPKTTTAWKIIGQVIRIYLGLNLPLQTLVYNFFKNILFINLALQSSRLCHISSKIRTERGEGGFKPRWISFSLWCCGSWLSFQGCIQNLFQQRCIRFEKPNYNFSLILSSVLSGRHVSALLGLRSTLQIPKFSDSTLHTSTRWNLRLETNSNIQRKS